MALIDSYSETNGTSNRIMYSGSIEGYGQSVVPGDNYILTSIVWYCRKNSSPTGNVYAKVYVSTGTHGTDAVPTGAALATSDPIDSTTLNGTGYSLETFSFTGSDQIFLASGTCYIFTIEFAGGDSSNSVSVRDDLTGAHGGNESEYNGSTWGEYGTRDVPFYLYGDAIELLDSYPTSNYAGGYRTLYNSTNGGEGHSLQFGSTVEITRLEFYLQATGSPTGNAYAKIYASTGTHGTNAVPTGAALATSDAVDVSGIPGSMTLTAFTFTGGNVINLTSGVCYIITVEYTAGDGSNYIRSALDYSGAHAGNESAIITSSWTSSGYEMIFYAYGNTVAVGVTPSVNDTVTVSESVSGYIEVNGSVVDTVTVSEDVSADIYTFSEVDVNDTVTVAEDITVELPVTLSAVDNVTTAESVTVGIEAPTNLYASVFDTVTISEVIKINEINISVFDTTALSESTGLEFTTDLMRSVNDTVSVGENIQIVAGVPVIGRELPLLYLPEFRGEATAEGGTETDEKLPVYSGTAECGSEVDENLPVYSCTSEVTVLFEAVVDAYLPSFSADIEGGTEVNGKLSTYACEAISYSNYTEVDKKLPTYRCDAFAYEKQEAEIDGKLPVYSLVSEAYTNSVDLDEKLPAYLAEIVAYEMGQATVDGKLPTYSSSGSKQFDSGARLDAKLPTYSMQVDSGVGDADSSIVSNESRLDYTLEYSE